MGCTLGCWDAERREVAWSVRIPNFVVQRLWAAGPGVLAQGVDEQGLEVLECRQLSTGAPAWSLALARGERLRFAALAPDAFYLASRQAARLVVRRLEASTGQVAWTHRLQRHEELAAWEASGTALVLGLTVSDDPGALRAEAVALDKATGELRQRLILGPGALVSLTRLGASLCAVVEAEPASARGPLVLGDDVFARPPQFRIVRITASP